MWSAPPQRAGKSPQAILPTSSPPNSNSQWQMLGLQIDHFQRTTDPQARPRGAAICSTAAAQNGYIYKGSYTGQYCIFDNLYVNEAKPGDPCPDCGRPTETVTEENFFFKLSAFTDRLLELYESQPDFIQPETRRNEVLSFVRQGLTDLSITRTNIKWGIPVDGEAPHVFYVWFDALTDYISAVEGKGSVARRLAPHRQGDSPLSRGVLAGVPDGRRLRTAQADLRPRLAAVRRKTR